jgi:hypothetical protein
MEIFFQTISQNTENGAKCVITPFRVKLLRRCTIICHLQQRIFLSKILPKYSKVDIINFAVNTVTPGIKIFGTLRSAYFVNFKHI